VALTPQRIAALEAEFLAVLGRQRIVTPDDVRGQSATLAAAVIGSAAPGCAWAAWGWRTVAPGFQVLHATPCAGRFLGVSGVCWVSRGHGAVAILS
jgi:hypothetical protein